jgi:hypothetical protein
MRSLNPWPIFPSNLDPPVARSLSIQFILQGVIDSFTLLTHLRNVTSHQLIGKNLKEELNCISREMEKILLFSLDNPFVQKSSLFDKLCFYSEILIQASHIRDNEMLLVLEEMRNAILIVRSKMLGWKKLAGNIEPIRSSLYELYDDLFGKLVRFFTALSRFLKEARSDENVLIYLIEKKDKLNESLGLRHIEDLLQSFFPAGHAQLRAAIFEGYTRRGFTTFLASVESLIDAIEWETPCHSPTIR